ncbi:hypothetical protein GCM10027610_022040 [Dactylosporangium cerinum]
MTEQQRISAFTSDQARAKFLATYTQTFDRLWPAAHESLDVVTSFGSTRVYRSGRTDGTPVVLLSGAGGNSLMWHRHIAQLSRARPVIAIDTVGEPGASDQRVPIGTGRELAGWLDEVLTTLGVTRAHLVGCSYGGWIAVQNALHVPGRAATVTLLDPAGFGRVTGRFMMWVIAGGLAGLTHAPLRRRLARPLRNATLRDDDLMRLAAVTMGFRRRLPAPPRSPTTTCAGSPCRPWPCSASGARCTTRSRWRVGSGRSCPPLASRSFPVLATTCRCTARTSSPSGPSSSSSRPKPWPDPVIRETAPSTGSDHLPVAARSRL